MPAAAAFDTPTRVEHNPRPFETERVGTVAYAALPLRHDEAVQLLRADEGLL